MKRLLLLVPLLMSLQSAAVANEFQSTLSERRSWDDFHCGFKTYKDNYQHYNRGPACNIRFDESRVILIGKNSRLAIDKELITKVWRLNVGTDFLTFISYKDDESTKVVSIGTTHPGRHGWLHNTLNVWLVNAL